MSSRKWSRKPSFVVKTAEAKDDERKVGSLIKQADAILIRHGENPENVRPTKNRKPIHGKNKCKRCPNMAMNGKDFCRPCAAKCLDIGATEQRQV